MVRAMSVRGNTKSDSHRKTHCVEPGGTGRKYMKLHENQCLPFRVFRMFQKPDPCRPQKSLRLCASVVKKPEQRHPKKLRVLRVFVVKQLVFYRTCRAVRH